MHQIILSTKNSEAYKEVRKAKKFNGMQFFGYCGFAFGAATAVFYLRGVFERDKSLFLPAALCGLATISCPIMSGAFKHKRNKANRDAIGLYNR